MAKTRDTIARETLTEREAAFRRADRRHQNAAEERDLAAMGALQVGMTWHEVAEVCGFQSSWVQVLQQRVGASDAPPAMTVEAAKDILVDAVAELDEAEAVAQFAQGERDAAVVNARVSGMTYQAIADTAGYAGVAWVQGVLRRMGKLPQRPDRTKVG